MPPYQSLMPRGPVPGTPAPPQAPNSTGNVGGRPPTSGGPSIAGTVNKWRQGIFGPPQQAPAGRMPQQQALPPAPGGMGSVPARPPSVATSPSPQRPQGMPPQQLPGQPGMIPGTGVPGAATLPTVPTPQEVAQLHPGSYETPIGTLIVRPDGPASVVLNPQGQELYRQKFAESVKAFGDHPFSNDPNAPPPPVNPGGMSFNPFTNTWVGGNSTPQVPR